MSAFKERWVAIAARFNGYSQRERALLAAATIGGVFMLGMTLLIDPNFVRSRAAVQQIAQATQDLGTTRVQLQSLRSQLQIDPDAAKRAEVATLQKELATVDAALKNLETGLVAPEQMNSVLERLLSRNAQVKLISFKSLTPVNLAAGISDGSKGADASKVAEAMPSAGLPGLYRHGVELRLEGRYADLLAWVSQLESSQQKVLWGDVRFSVTEYPQAVLTLTVYTLNMERSWLEI